MSHQQEKLGFVVIGRNEGDRLKASLKSIKSQSPRAKVCYVDSGSTDESVAFAESLGCLVVNLDMSLPFTAARARNEGWKLLSASYSNISLIHFIDGDCELMPNWVSSAIGFLDEYSGYAVVCGRRVERKPNASVYNRLCDIEWNTPVGDAESCGGDAIIRVEALKDVNGYDEEFIAGEEPEMCFRLRKHGWKIRRLDSDMTLHDANILKLSQWWKRNTRAGYAYTLGFIAHGKETEKYKVKEVRRILAWGCALPILTFLLSTYNYFFMLLFVMYPLQIARLSCQMRSLDTFRFTWGLFNVLGKFAEASGSLFCFWNHFLDRRQSIIEYK